MSPRLLAGLSVSSRRLGLLSCNWGFSIGTLLSYGYFNNRRMSVGYFAAHSPKIESLP
jgi:hypothetical protein